MDDIHVSWWIGQIASLGALIFSMGGLFPFIVAIVPLFYYGLMIYDHPRVMKWRHSRRQRRIAKLIVEAAKLKARAEIDTALDG